MRKNCLFLGLFYFWITIVYGQECEIKEDILTKVRFNHLIYTTNHELQGLGIDTYFNGRTYDLYLRNCILYIRKCNKLKINYPKKNIVLFELLNNQSLYSCDSNKYYTNYRFFNDKFLIGIDSITNDILFLSGSFYQSPIAHHFTLDVSDPNTFIDFLQVKFHAYDMENFKYLKTTKSEIIFSADLPLYEASNIIFINLNDYDDIQRTTPNNVDLKRLE